MDPELKQKLQITLVIVLVLAAARTAYIFYERRQAEAPVPQERSDVTHHTLTADDNVYERPFYGYDLETTKQKLSKTTVWMKAGNYYSYFPYDSAAHHANLDKAIGTLPPLEKLEIQDVYLQPGKKGRQMMAVFRRAEDKRLFAVPIGSELNGKYNIIVNDELFRQDPRELYKHWNKETWAAIDGHEPKKGMSELQMWFALGVGTPTSSGDFGNRTLRYESAGKPMEVRFEGNQAVEIKAVK